jgi:hypothetical protein
MSAVDKAINGALKKLNKDLQPASIVDSAKEVTAEAAQARLEKDGENVFAS